MDYEFICRGRDFEYLKHKVERKKVPDMEIHEIYKNDENNTVKFRISYIGNNPEFFKDKYCVRYDEYITQYMDGEGDITSLMSNGLRLLWPQCAIRYTHPNNVEAYNGVY